MKVGNWLEIDRDELSKRQWVRLFKRLTFADFDGNVYEPWRYLVRTDRVRVPRGAWNLLPDDILYDDERVCPPGRTFTFRKELDAHLPDGRTFTGQRDALRAMQICEQGLVILPPGSGKTQIGLAFCAEVGTPSLVIVHTEDLLQQWLEYAEEAVPDATIGVIRQNDETIGDFTIATVQTLSRRIAESKRWGKMFGCVILDEAHHAPASTFETVLNNSWAKYRFGLTATEMRADGTHPYMKLVIGPVIYKKKFHSPVPIRVVEVRSDFGRRYRGSRDWGNLVRALIADPDRNKLIAQKVDKEIRKGNSVVVLSRRIAQLENVQSFMEEPAELMAASKKTKPERKQILHDFKSGALKCVLATQLADEGLDVPILSRVFLIHPGKAEGRIIQQVGRAIRESPGKTNALIFDIHDKRVSVLDRQYAKRRRAYRKMKIPIGRRRSLWRKAA
jgi:superfamily II DNA or RNA helicase